MRPPCPRLETPRLWLVAPEVGLAAAVADFYRRNHDHFAPWDPPQPPERESLDWQRNTLADGADAFIGGRGWRWWLLARGEPQRVIGSVQLSNLARGPFQNCSLGYALDVDWQGQGLMQEALAATLAEAFAPAINLHRIQAAVRPENIRSLAVMRRLGFRYEGLARHYLFIAGAWRDHRIFALTNPGFIAPAGW